MTCEFLCVAGWSSGRRRRIMGAGLAPLRFFCWSCACSCCVPPVVVSIFFMACRSTAPSCYSYRVCGVATVIVSTYHCWLSFGFGCSIHAVVRMDVLCLGNFLRKFTYGVGVFTCRRSRQAWQVQQVYSGRGSFYWPRLAAEFFWKMIL